MAVSAETQTALIGGYGKEVGYEATGTEINHWAIRDSKILLSQKQFLNPVSSAWSPGDGWTLPAMGSGELTPCFALLVCVAFASPIKLSLSQATSYLTFSLLIVSLMPLVEEWVSGCLGLGCWLGSNHDTVIFRQNWPAVTSCPSIWELSEKHFVLWLIDGVYFVAYIKEKPLFWTVIYKPGDKQKTSLSYWSCRRGLY